jgi:hypothetical protein
LTVCAQLARAESKREVAAAAAAAAVASAAAAGNTAAEWSAQDLRRFIGAIEALGDVRPLGSVVRTRG